MRINCGTGYIVTLPSEDAEQRLLALLAERKENYPIICKETAIHGLPHYWYPVRHLIFSLDGHFLTLQSTEPIEGMGMIIRHATNDDLKWFL